MRLRARYAPLRNASPGSYRKVQGYARRRIQLPPSRLAVHRPASVNLQPNRAIPQGTVLSLLLLPAPLLAQTPMSSWALEETLRIGSVTGAVTFSEVSSLTVSPDGGRLYVAQPQQGSIQMFDAVSGESLRTIGRFGEGPGEFRRLTNLGWRADTLYATDLQLDRVAFFSPEGDHLRTTRSGITFQESVGRASHPVGLSSAGYLIGQIRYTSDVLAGGAVTTSPWSLVNVEGGLVSYLAIQDLRETSGAAPIGPATIYFVHPLSRRTFLALSPDGDEIVVVNQPAGLDPPGNYRVIRFDASGEQTLARDYQYEPQRLLTAFADSMYSSVAAHLEQLVPRGQAMTAARRYWNIPEYFPPIAGVVVSRDGEIWLRRDHQNEGAAAWLVLDDQGRFKAAVRAPAGLRIYFVDGSTVWGTIRNELDVEFVVRYEIRT